ncbi:MAG: hypothetical protein IJ963_04100 [Phascolarctobacterium sp.]|nr:hypothetical protein [Phascolarctobacterium sp.]
MIKEEKEAGIDYNNLVLNEAGASSKGLKVLVTRGTAFSGQMEIDVSLLKDATWSSVTGGYGNQLPSYCLFAYAPYDYIVEEGKLSCSGAHSKYNNGMKLLVPMTKNRCKEYRKGLELLLEQANANGKRPIGPIHAGRTYCCRRVLELLNEAPNGEMERWELIYKLIDEDYWETTAVNVLRRLRRQGVLKATKVKRTLIYSV